MAGRPRRDTAARRRARAPWALGLALLAPVRLAAGAVAACDETTPLSVLGIDTGSGAVLFAAAAGPAGGGVRLIELLAGEGEARSFAQPSGPARFSGSIGPGPVFALARCGEGCVAAERWRQGAWTALGEPVEVAAGSTLSPTYDREGHPWLLAHRPAGAPGWFEARAWLLEGGRWRERGRQPVRAVGSPAGAPAPWLADGVVSGTGLFRAGAEPTAWAHGLPALPPEKEGHVVPLSAAAAAYLAGDGAVYLSVDAGATWRGTRWKPWGVERSEIWTFGNDYDLDVPLGALGDPLPVAWFDRRPGRAASLTLTEVTADGRWSVRGQVSPEIEVGDLGRFELAHLLRTAGGTWLLATDCFATGGAAAIAVQELTPAGVAKARAVAVR